MKAFFVVVLFLLSTAPSLLTASAAAVPTTSLSYALSTSLVPHTPGVILTGTSTTTVTATYSSLSSPITSPSPVPTTTAVLLTGIPTTVPTNYPVTSTPAQMGFSGTGMTMIEYCPAGAIDDWRTWFFSFSATSPFGCGGVIISVAGGANSGSISL